MRQSLGSVPLDGRLVAAGGQQLVGGGNIDVPRTLFARRFMLPCGLAVVCRQEGEAPRLLLAAAACQAGLHPVSSTAAGPP